VRLERWPRGNRAVSEEISVFEPNQFTAAHERQCLQSFDCRSYPRSCLLGVVRRAIDHFQSEIARARRR